jgi:predicted dehydrogenase
VIQVGVIGAGTAALTAHLPALRSSTRFRLVGICDADPERLAEALECFPARGFESVEKLLQEPELDAVVVATPPGSHAAIAGAALGARKHVLCEKPLAPSVQECRELVKLATERRVVLAVGHEKRFHPSLERVRKIIAAGSLGRLFYGGVHWASNAKLDPDRLIPDGFRHGYEWRWRDPGVGGGLIQDHLPHYVDLLRHWTGQEPVVVHAYCANVARDVLGWPPHESVWEDLGLVVVHFSDGFVLRFETSVVGRSISPIWALGSGMGEWTEYGYLLGAGGQLVFDLLPWDSSENGRIALWQRDGEGWIHVEQPEPPRRCGGAAALMFGGQVEAWADAITGLPSDVATGADGLVCVASVEAAYRAADAPGEAVIE